MRRLSALVLCLFLFGIFGISTSAGESATYDFDEVNVIYAAEFQALSVSAQPGQWFTDIAGGADQPLTILYGIVSLKTLNPYGEITEEFIKITGKNGSERFLLNSFSRQGSQTQSFFWSAKKLEGNTVIKDFTPPIKSVTLQKTYGPDRNLASIELSFSSEGDKTANEFWTGTLPQANLYHADMATLHTTGEPPSDRGPL